MDKTVHCCFCKFAEPVKYGTGLYCWKLHAPTKQTPATCFRYSPRYPRVIVWLLRKLFV